MSTFEKIIIPLIVDNIQPIDLTNIAGFIDSYTYDPDRPTGFKEFYLVYDDRVRNEYVQNRALRLESCRNLKRMYVKTVNNVPYYVYSFWVPDTISGWYDGIVSLTTSQKVLLLRFWGEFDSVVDRVLNEGATIVSSSHDMPLEDYPEDIEGITVTKKETASNEVASFFCCLNIERLRVIGPNF